MKTSSVIEGNLAALVSCCLFGASVVAIRRAVDDIAPLNLAFLRYAIGGVFLVAGLALAQFSSLRIPRAEILRVAALGLLLYSLFPVIFNTSLTYTTASRAAVILALMPLFTATIGSFAGSERLLPAQWFGVAISFVGIGVVFAESGLGVDDGNRTLIGNGLAMLTALSGAVYGVLAKPVLARVGSSALTAWGMLAGASVLLLPALFNDVGGEVAAASSRTVWLILFLAIPGGAIGFFLIAFALARLSPTQVAIYLNLNPLVAALLAALLLDEVITRWFAFGFALVIAGLLCTNVAPLLAKRSVSAMT